MRGHQKGPGGFLETVYVFFNAPVADCRIQDSITVPNCQAYFRPVNGNFLIVVGFMAGKIPV